MFLFLESLFQFLAHRTYNSLISNLFEWERRAEPVRMCAIIPQCTTWIGSRMVWARRVWRTIERINVWSLYWWGCISRWVNMTTTFLMMLWSAGNLHLAQNTDFNDGSMTRADVNELQEMSDYIAEMRGVCEWEINESTSEERWHDVRAHEGFHLLG